MAELPGSFELHGWNMIAAMRGGAGRSMTMIVVTVLILFVAILALTAMKPDISLL